MTDDNYVDEEGYLCGCCSPLQIVLEQYEKEI